MSIELYDGPRQKCAWPNLTLLPGGDIVAAVFDQPCHGRWEGDIECWGSRDGGQSWQLRSLATEHEPGTNRMNCSVGLTGAGALIMACGGWDERGPVGESRGHADPARTLQATVRRSEDGGHNWSTVGLLPDTPTDSKWGYVPFGDIITGATGSLHTAVYSRVTLSGGTPGYEARFTSSSDDGATWSEPKLLNPVGNETAILYLGDSHWIAASREEACRDIHLFRSTDDGKRWTRGAPMSLPGQVTGHLMRVADGRILFCYGNRCRNMTGVDFRLSDDDGETWSSPVRLVDTPGSDCGYPSTIQREDGRLVTALYAQQPGEYQYAMPVAIWDLDDPTPKALHN